MKRKTTTQSAPKHLSTTAKSWWNRIMAEYQITDDAGILILQTALEAHDRMKSCQAAIEADGILISDRFGGKRSHPLLSAERDARGQFLAGLKALNLDLEPLRDRVGRPPGV